MNGWKKLEAEGEAASTSEDGVSEMEAKETKQMVAMFNG